MGEHASDNESENYSWSSDGEQENEKRTCASSPAPPAANGGASAGIAEVSYMIFESCFLVNRYTDDKF